MNTLPRQSVLLSHTLLKDGGHMEKIFTLTVMMFSFSGILLLGLEIPEELGEAYRFEYRVIIIQNPLIWISYPAFIDLPNVDALNAAVEKFVEEMWEKWKEELAYAQKNLVKYHQQVDYYLTFEINWPSEDLVSIIFQDSAYTGGGTRSAFDQSAQL